MPVPSMTTPDPKETRRRMDVSCRGASGDGSNGGSGGSGGGGDASTFYFSHSI